LTGNLEITQKLKVYLKVDAASQKLLIGDEFVLLEEQVTD
jgi:hypothetical protein